MITIPPIPEAFSPSLIVKWWRDIQSAPGNYYVDCGWEMLDYFRDAMMQEPIRVPCIRPRLPGEIFAPKTTFTAARIPYRSGRNFKCVNPYVEGTAWYCRRCQSVVDYDKFRCNCTESPSPWELRRYMKLSSEYVAAPHELVVLVAYHDANSPYHSISDSFQHLIWVDRSKISVDTLGKR